MATESYWNLSFGTVLEASLHFNLEEELVVLAVLEQQLFDTDSLKSSREAVRQPETLFLDSQGWLHLF